MAAHFRNPYIKTGARQIRTQANTPGRIPETPVGKAAVQQNHRGAAHLGLVSQTETGDRQLNGAIRAVTGFDPVDVFAQITATLGTEQGHGK
ncbi:hypothetical protein D3C72_2271910 [compost metagenome]